LQLHYYLLFVVILLFIRRRSKSYAGRVNPQSFIYTYQMAENKKPHQTVRPIFIASYRRYN